MRHSCCKPSPSSQPASYACHCETDVVGEIDVYLCPQHWLFILNANSCTRCLDTASMYSGVMAVMVVKTALVYRQVIHQRRSATWQL